MKKQYTTQRPRKTRRIAEYAIEMAKKYKHVKITWEGILRKEQIFSAKWD